jgi:glycosyltransferase involved in cell wall biosynthesis
MHATAPGAPCGLHAQRHGIFYERVPNDIARSIDSSNSARMLAGKERLAVVYDPGGTRRRERDSPVDHSNSGLTSGAISSDIRVRSSRRGLRVTTLVWREEAANPVIREQVVLRAAGLAAAGFDSMVVFAGTPRQNLLGRDLPPVRFEERRGILALAQLVAAELRSRDESTVLICRNSVVAAIAVLLRRVTRARGRIVHDARGWYEGHSLEQREARFLRVAKRLVDRVAYRHSDHSVVVSQALFGIALRHGADPARVTVIPQFVPAPVSNDPPRVPPADVVYVGTSATAYQPVASVSSLLESLAERLPSTRFGWLDGTCESERPILIRENLWRHRVAPDIVARVLALAHAGLVIRTPGPSNGVAAPTKTAQYRAAGCAVVTGPNPPSTAEIALHSGGEVVIDPEDPESWARAVRAVLERPRPGRADYGQPLIDQWAAVIERMTRR